MMEHLGQASKDPYATDEWEVWYRDTFDRETPPRAEARGRGLIRGLAELWARHLFEAVQADGSHGFSSFYLRWKQGRVDITGDWEGAKCLRRWLFGEQSISYKGYVAEANSDLLNKVAHAHACGIEGDHAAERILTVAAKANDREELERYLAELINK